MRCVFDCSPNQLDHAALVAFRGRCQMFWSEQLASGLRAMELCDRLREVDPSLRAEWLEPSAVGGSLEVDTLAVYAEDAAFEPRRDLLVDAVPRQPRLDVRRGLPPRPARALLGKLAKREGLDLSQARIRAGFGRGHLLDLVVAVPGLAAPGDADNQAAVEHAVRAVLGDALFHVWIGTVQIAAAPRQGPLRVVQAEPAAASVSFDELLATVHAARDGTLAGLPSGPLSELPAAADWVMFELEPEPGEDWPEQDDLLLATTRLPEALKCYLSGAPFCSSRFSRHGEALAYLKYRTSTDSAEARLAQRSVLEERVEQALGGARLGAVVGNGLGIRYAYVNLVLRDVRASLSVLREVAQSCDLPAQSWLLFCDDRWSLEWVALRPPAPAPPL